MFDFLLRYFRKKQPDPVAFSEEKKSARQAEVNKTREAAIRQAEALPDDENEALAFILQNSSADARFIAAQKIHSKEALEQVKSAMRNTDRRVTRLMHARLDALLQSEKQHEAIRACIDSAKHLKNSAHLFPGQVTELDRQWESAKKTGETGDHDAGLYRQYETIRTEIGERLASQGALQRQVMDTLSALKRLEEEGAALPLLERQARLAALFASLEDQKQSREWVTLPPRLVNDLQETKARLESHMQKHVQAHEEALALRITLLEKWENTDISTLQWQDILDKWQSLPLIHDPAHMLQLQTRFDMFAAGFSRGAGQVESISAGEPRSPDTEVLFAEALSLMKKAIESGSVREAMQQSGQIARLDFSLFEPDAGQKALLAELRAELGKLVGWAKWREQASREELISMMQALPEQDCSPEELAAAVMDAREKWKALNASSGMASKSQWQQFDAACNRAYEPVLEQARSEAAVREQNVREAQLLIDRIRETLPGLKLSSGEDETDWRSLIAYQKQMQRAWREIGPVIRKEKKRLNAGFEEVMHPLNALLKEKNEKEVQRRKKLIGEMGSLDPENRKSGRMARELQEKWQEYARAFPLDNRENQKLWQQFREASDAVFAHRDKLNEEAEKARQHSLHEKEKICEKLEKEQAGTIEAIQQALGAAHVKWLAAGAVSRESESAIQKRYDDAVSALQSKIQEIRERERSRDTEALMELLSICQQMENAIPDHSELTERLKNRWDAQPLDKWKKRLNPRFEAAFKALAEKDTAYAQELKSRQQPLFEQLLRLEIIAAVDSPPEFAGNRRQVQMEVLREALSGNRNDSLQGMLDALCERPVLTDRVSADRIARLIRKAGGFSD